MISLSKLLFDENYHGDKLRYHDGANQVKNGTGRGFGPVVVWNSTRRCNLACRHCYADAADSPVGGELTTDEAKNFFDGLAAFHVPALLISGGEPLMRQDFFELAAYAKSIGLRITLSTNGTLIDPAAAAKIKECGITYVGISLDGRAKINDTFRGKYGAYDKALAGIRNCIAAGQRVGLRFTINGQNKGEIDGIFDLIEREKIDRVCFYHLVYAGRGTALKAADVTKENSRSIIGQIVRRAKDFKERGIKAEILTVDNHADGPYLYLAAKKSGDTETAERIKKYLAKNGGNRCGVAFGAVDEKGDVHPDQFSRHITFGNIKDTPFSKIWQNSAGDEILAGLKSRATLLKGRCQSCQFLSVCNGNFRARAEAVSGDYWGEDPACYLTDEEILNGFN